MGNAASLFDTMGGTSTGGILVAGLSMPEYEGSTKPKYKALDISKLYENEGDKIFQKYQEQDQVSSKLDSIGSVGKALFSGYQYFCLPTYGDQGRNQVMK
jgi:patatin-like phospholipase/acyl hydrolase